MFSGIDTDTKQIGLVMEPLVKAGKVTHIPGSIMHPCKATQLSQSTTLAMACQIIQIQSSLLNTRHKSRQLMRLLSRFEMAPQDFLVLSTTSSLQATVWKHLLKNPSHSLTQASLSFLHRYFQFLFQSSALFSSSPKPPSRKRYLFHPKATAQSSAMI